jgi:hypothetical protein
VCGKIDFGADVSPPSSALATGLAVYAASLVVFRVVGAAVVELEFEQFFC